MVPKVYAVAMLVMAVLFWFLTTEDPLHRKDAAARTRVPLGDQLKPLLDVRVWRFGLAYYFVFGAFVAALFTGGMLPAVVLGAALCFVVWWRCRGEDLSNVTRFSRREMLTSTLPPSVAWRCPPSSPRPCSPAAPKPCLPACWCCARNSAWRRY